MASSVASAKEMERWRREREQTRASRVEVGETARKSFHAMKVDVQQLEKFERKAHELVERQEAKEREITVDPIINVMGSTAGAGSGTVLPYQRSYLLAVPNSDFHTYRGYRAKEEARLQDFEKQRREEAARKAWEKARSREPGGERDELAAEEAARAAKRAEKRNKKKARVRATFASILLISADPRSTL
ncbi:MAG: hypothetical protein SGPRY_005714 [Prymnesium sp.]